MQIPPYYDTEYGSDYDDLDLFLDDDFARRSLIGGECYLRSVFGCPKTKTKTDRVSVISAFEKVWLVW